MYSEMLEGDRIAEMALHNPQLVKGIAASLRTLIISSFRAPSTQFVMALLKVSASGSASVLPYHVLCYAVLSFTITLYSVYHCLIEGQCWRWY